MHQSVCVCVCECVGELVCACECALIFFFFVCGYVLLFVSCQVERGAVSLSVCALQLYLVASHESEIIVTHVEDESGREGETETVRRIIW